MYENFINRNITWMRGNLTFLRSCLYGGSYSTSVRMLKQFKRISA